MHTVQVLSQSRVGIPELILMTSTFTVSAISTSGLFSWAKSAWRRANYFRYVTLLSMTADLIHL